MQPTTITTRRGRCSVWATAAALWVLCATTTAWARPQTQDPPAVKPTDVQANPDVPDAQPPTQDRPADADPNGVPADATGTSAQEALGPALPPQPAVVTEVKGNVDWAPAGVSVLASDGWTAINEKDELWPGTLIRTGLRSYVHLQFKDTRIRIEQASFVSLDDVRASATTEYIRLGLGYGSIRGGSSEGEVRSDVRVESTVATLAKRGTEGWAFSVEPQTGRFTISLAEYGLVEAIRKLGEGRRISRLVRPGEYANESNIADLWLKQDIFDRTIKFFDAYAVTAADATFFVNNPGGLSSVAPGGGTTLLSLTRGDRAGGGSTPVSPPPIAVILPPVSRPEGNFGTGPVYRVLVPRSSNR